MEEVLEGKRRCRERGRVVQRKSLGEREGGRNSVELRGSKRKVLKEASRKREEQL